MTKQVKKMFLNKIAEINEMLQDVKRCEDVPFSYAGTTIPFYIELDKKIEIKNQFVYIFEKNQKFNYGFAKRYNTNSAEGENSKDHLLYDLNLIKKTFKAHIKKNLICKK
jgi:hypothetical protein